MVEFTKIAASLNKLKYFIFRILSLISRSILFDRPIDNLIVNNSDPNGRNMTK